MIKKQIERSSLSANDSIKITSFEILPTDSDSILLSKFLNFKKKISTSDSSSVNYYENKLFYPKDSTFKIINLYGDYSGGATYNPFAESYIIYKNKLCKQEIEGETLKIEKKSDTTYQINVDDFWRLGSNFNSYTVSFGKDSVSIEKNSKN